MDIDKKEILRYLGQKKPDKITEALIDECLIEIENISNPRYVYKYFHIEVNNTVGLINTNIFLSGDNILKHLIDCDKICVLAVTLGIEIDKYIGKTELTNILKAFVLDATASHYIERYENQIIKKIQAENKFITTAFSPGYGDLPIQSQKDILSAINANKAIGLTITEDNIMIPRKSITGIIGISDKKVTGALSGCGNCKLYHKCEYRKQGVLCENQK